MSVELLEDPDGAPYPERVQDFAAMHTPVPATGGTAAQVDYRDAFREGLVEALEAARAPLLEHVIELERQLHDQQLVARLLRILRKVDASRFSELDEPTSGERYYRQHAWSGCAGSDWPNLTQATRDAWEHCARLQRQLEARS